MDSSIPLILGSSWTSGINLYMTAAILGVAHRFHWLSLPGDLSILANPLIILLAVMMYVVEFFADKVPFFDSVWDMIHTFIRPAGGAAIGYLATADAAPIIHTATALLTGSVALSSHLTKATARAAMNTTPVPGANVVVSVGEDAAVGGVMFFIIKHPIIATLIIVALIALSIWLLRKFFRFLKRLFNPVKKEEVSPQPVPAS